MSMKMFRSVNVKIYLITKQWGFVTVKEVG